MDKPIKSKPVFYAVCLPELQEIAKNKGYNLLPHGSMNRDFDLICVAWTDLPSSHEEVLKEFSEFPGCYKTTTPDGKPYYMHSVLPGGRDSYVIHLNYGFNSLGRHTDDQWYLDISFTPTRNEQI